MTSKKTIRQRDKQTHTKEKVPPSLKPMAKKRLWAFRLTAMIGVPLISLLCLEMGLRLSGYGYSTEIAIKQTVNGKDRYCYNQRLGWRFFPKRLARDLGGFAFDLKKPPETYRIFVLGASAAQGYPDEAYYLGRFLEIMLENEYTQTDFEVINTAMTAINSHAVYHIAKSCATFEPDLIIVYLGNNEVVGPYGAGTVFAPISPNLAMIRANAAITRTKTGQLLQSLPYVIGTNDKIPQSWGGMKMFLGEQVRHDSEVLEVVYGHFEQNLRDICNVGIQAGANVIVSNVGCNLKDNAPFASQHRDGLTESEKHAWDTYYQKGMTDETAGDFEAAVASYLAAGQIDDTFADLQFRLGRCYWRLAHYEHAKERYTLAREYDTLRFRADATINQIIQSVSESRESEGVYFVDAIKALEANSPHHVPGHELFYEHVHYRFEGNYILAKTIFEQVKKILPEAITQHKKDRPVLSLADCQNRLVYTPIQRYSRAVYVRQNLINKPPFTNQSYHDELVKKLDNEADHFEQHINLEKTRALYNQQIERHPQDWMLRWKRALFYVQDPERRNYAAGEFKKVLQTLPYYKAYKGLLPILILQNQLDEAETYARELLTMRPTSADAYFQLGNISRKKGDSENAIKYFSKCLDLKPDGGGSVHKYLAEAFVKSRKPEKAIQTLYKAIEFLPEKERFPIHAQLGSLLYRQGHYDKALEHMETALKINPDYANDKTFQKNHDIIRNKSNRK